MSDDYYNLFNPPGAYGLISFGSTRAVTLRGSPLFREKAINLFSSFGGESNRGSWLDSRKVVVHDGVMADSCFFCMPEERVKTTLRLYLFGQLYAAAPKVDVFDEEGDFLESTCPTEDSLMEQAIQLAIDFMASNMLPDYSVVPESYQVAPIEEYAEGIVDTNDYS